MSAIARTHITPAARTALAWLLALALAAGVAGCGRKGPPEAPDDGPEMQYPADW